MKNRRASRLFVTSTNYCLLVSLSALTLCALRGIALAETCSLTTIWTGANGSWFVDGNWSNHVPNSGTNAFIGNTGTANIGSTENADACDLVLGFGATESGTVSVNSGRLTVGNELEVGGYGKGKLSITNGATVSARLATIAALQGSSDSGGTVTVDGGTLTIATRADVGGDNGNQGGIALMAVTNGAAVTVTNGYLRVYPSGTLMGNGTLSTTSGTTIQGTLTPSGGTFIIGGNLTFSGTVASMECNVVPASADNVNLSGVASLAGKISVTMTGSTFTAGTTYTLLHADGTVSGTFPFVSIKGGSGECFTPIITYDAHNVYLYLSPCSG